MRRIVVLALAVAVLTSSLATGATKVMRVERALDIPSFMGYVQNEFIVVLKEDQAASLSGRVLRSENVFEGMAGMDAVAQRFGVERVKKQFINTTAALAASSSERKLAAHFKVLFRQGTLDQAMEAYAALPEVDHVEPIGIHALSLEPNDTYYDNPPPGFPHNAWHIKQSADNDIDGNQAWDIQPGDATVVVADLDSGFRYNHADLGGTNPPGPNDASTNGNIWVNTDEIPGNGQDDDGNGYVDDVIGYDFVTNPTGCGSAIGEDCSTPDNDPADHNGHGTATAGCIAAITNNGGGVVGVAGGDNGGSAATTANGCKIMTLRIGWSDNLARGFVRMDYAAEAMNYAVGKKQDGHNVAAINCSWGSSNSGGINAAVDAALANDIMVIKSAGNAGNSIADFLGNKAGVMNVASTDSTDTRSSFSSYGSWVDCAAPGSDIITTYHSYQDPASDYVVLIDGTSFSAPITAGIAALLESQDPSLTGPEKFDLIVQNGDNIGSQQIGPRVNANNALLAINPCDITADFSASVTSGCAPLAVTFTDLSTGTGINGWLWDFGDGNGSTAQNPSHSYTSAGTYTVTLTASSATCSDGEVKTGYITVSETPVADFSGTPTSGDEPLNVSFTDLSSGNPTDWSWNFGDGNTSTAQNPSHTYATFGTYTVALTASNTCGPDGETKVDYITVNQVVGPTDMSVSAISVIISNQGQGNKRAEATVTVVDNNGDPVNGATVTGDFSGKTTDNGVSGATNAGGQVTLFSSTAKGGGDWCFEVTNVTGSLTYTPGANVETCDCTGSATCTPAGLTANFSGSPTSGTAPLLVSFTDESTGGTPTSWSWDFGDGMGTSSQQNPQYTYANAGQYTVSLTVSDGVSNDTETKTNYITVTGAGGTEMRVSNIVVTKQNVGGGNKQGVATVTILDDGNNPVANASVTGDFSGKTSDVGLNGITNGSGEVVFTSSSAKGGGEWCFEVTNVTHASLTYNAASNNVTQACESGPVFGNGGAQIAIVPQSAGLLQNHPNPFNAQTRIDYQVTEGGYVRLDVFNMLGQMVNTLVAGQRSAGSHSVMWDGKDFQGALVSSGTYFYRLTQNGQTDTKQMTLLK